METKTKTTHFFSVSEVPPTFLEITSKSTEVIPGQAYSIGELLQRATRGQRLNVAMRPSNFVQDTEPGVQYSEEHYRKPGDDDYENTPGFIDDRVDLDEVIARHHQRKTEFVEHMKQLKKEKEDVERAKRSKKDDADDPTTWPYRPTMRHTWRVVHERRPSD